MINIVRIGFALLCIGNGIAMLADPGRWYLTVPGVLFTGPLNVHFVRDIGCAYLVTGLSFLWLARNRDAWPATMAGTAFLALHAGVHLFEVACGIAAPSTLLRDLPGVYLFPVAALWLAWPQMGVAAPYRQSASTSASAGFGGDNR